MKRLMMQRLLNARKYATNLSHVTSTNAKNHVVQLRTLDKIHQGDIYVYKPATSNYHVESILAIVSVILGSASLADTYQLNLYSVHAAQSRLNPRLNVNKCNPHVMVLARKYYRVDISVL